MIARTPDDSAGAFLRSQIETQLASGGVQCWQYVLDLISDRLGDATADLRGPALLLSKANATPGACGAVVTAVIALGAARGPGETPLERSAAPMGYLSANAPSNDLLNMQPAIGVAPPVVALGQELIERISAAVNSSGPIDCAEITGVDWGDPKREQVTAYFSANGGMSRCVEIIATAVEAFSDLTDD
jgi:hypothetical protein